MKICICILAKNEGSRIAATLKGLSRQSVFDEAGSTLEVHVVANGCTDDTAAAASACMPVFDCRRAELHVHDTPQGGKSRAWNRMVHEFAGSDVDLFVFLDADIDFVDDLILAEMVAHLQRETGLQVCAGYPVKDVILKKRRNLLESFSLEISRHSRHVDAISGQLYVVRSEALQEVWLPNETPGEDGFLNAMINTSGFTMEPTQRLIAGHQRPTHYYQNLNPVEFIQHERRLIVGTIINRWIFEYLWSLQLEKPAGYCIKDWNDNNDAWVEQIIRKRAVGQRWLVPNAIVFSRFGMNRSIPRWKRLAYFPLATAATLISLPAAFAANRRLKAAGAAATW